MMRTLGILSLLFVSMPILIQINVVYQLQKFYAFVMPTGVTDGERFDFIVVGAGSAGSAVTGRLVEEGHNVLLVEAGGPPHYLQKVPGLCMAFMTKPGTYSWPYITTPQKDALKAYPNNQLRVSHGKSLGGSSMLNYMLYVRGNSKDYDEWEDLGNPGWGWKDVYPYFKRSELLHNVDQTVDGQQAHIDKDKHGSNPQSGRLHVMPPRDIPFGSRLVGEAAKELGYTYGDYNGNSQDKETIYRAQQTVKDGLRADSYSSYISNQGLETRGNLKVLNNAMVSKVLLNNEKNAIGIEVTRFGEKSKYFVNNEVILSAGAIGSPKILMHSGIGPKEHLDEVGVEVSHDLKGVGLNVQDHLMIFTAFRSKNSTGVSKRVIDILNPFKLIKYAFDRKGDVHGNSHIEAGLFVKSSFQSKNGDAYNRPDIQIHSAPAGFNGDYGFGFSQMSGMSIDHYNAMFRGKNGDIEDQDTISLMPTILRPKSRGRIRLASSDPNKLPLIDPNYLSHPDDVETLAAGMELIHKFKDTPAFKKYQMTLVPDIHNCGDAGEVGSRNYFRCYARHHAHTVWHFSGSCKMGPQSDPMAVVDHRLRVHGVQGLRVVDASIMPTLVGANTNAPSIMIGDKAADIISQDYKDVAGKSAAQKEKTQNRKANQEL